TRMITIDDFVSRLCNFPERDFTVPRVAAFVREHPIAPESLNPFLFYAATHYTRNLIYKCPLFELLVICWDVGQKSRIHNHHNQNCWMAATIGRLAVQNYEVVQEDSAGSYCKLREVDRLVMDADHSSYVDPAKPIHSVLNLAEYQARAASVH